MCDRGPPRHTVYTSIRVLALFIYQILRQRQKAEAFRYPRDQRLSHRVPAALSTAQTNGRRVPGASVSEGARVVLLESYGSSPATTLGRKIWKQSQQSLPISTWERLKEA